MPFFVKRPITIEAHRYDGTYESSAFLIKWMGGGRVSPINGNALIISTLEGDMMARPGSYVIRGTRGEFYPCDPGIFAETYQEVEVDEVGSLAS